MKHLNLFIELTRLKKPIGFMLLFWPCVWGLTLAYDFSNDLNNYFFYLSLFFLGSVLMRSAGCIINDIFDKDKWNPADVWLEYGSLPDHKTLTHLNNFCYNSIKSVSGIVGVSLKKGSGTYNFISFCFS